MVGKTDIDHPSFVFERLLDERLDEIDVIVDGIDLSDNIVTKFQT